MELRVVSDLKYQIVLLPKLDPPMTEKMKRKLIEIASADLTELNVLIKSTALNDDYHVFTISAPPGVTPVDIAKIIHETSSSRLIPLFRELKGWGAVYYDTVLIKSGSRPGKEQIRQFIDISFNGI